MKVAVISRCSQVFPHIRGGADMTAVEYALSLACDNESVIFVGRGQLKIHSKNLKFVNISSLIRINSKSQVMYYLKAFILVLWATFSAFVTIRKEKPEVVYTFSSFTTIILKKLFKGLPIVYTVVDPIYPVERRASIELLVRHFNNWIMERIAVDLSDKIIAISKDVKQQIIDLGVSRDKISVLYPMPSPFLKGESLLTSHSSLRDIVDKPYVLSVGSQMGRKRFDILIEATKYLDNNLRLVLVGNGSQRRCLETMVSLHGLSDRVRFMDGVDDSTLATLYENSQMFVLVSEREGFPISMVEAATHGSLVLYFNPNMRLSENYSDSFLIFPNISPIFIAQRINEHLAKRTGGEDNKNKNANWAKTFFSTDEKMRMELTIINQTVKGRKVKSVPTNNS